MLAVLGLDLTPAAPGDGVRPGELLDELPTARPTDQLTAAPVAVAICTYGTLPPENCAALPDAATLTAAITPRAARPARPAE